MLSIMMSFIKYFSPALLGPFYQVRLVEHARLLKNIDMYQIMLLFMVTCGKVFMLLELLKDD